MSEYDQLLLIIPPEKNLSILNKQLLYNGISLTKQKCLIIGNKAYFLKDLKKITKEFQGFNVLGAFGI